MKIGFFSKLAMSNIIKNRKLYIPHILTGGGLAAIFYIIKTLASDKTLETIRGGSYIPTIMGLGVNVVAILSFILMLYTNSFVMKQRKKELGLYNILGMEKRHVGRVLFFESFFSGISSIVIGIVSGIVLYKICVIVICKILKVKTILGFNKYYFNTILPTILFFAAIYLITYIFNRVHVARMKLVELIKSENMGEKEPKVKWIMCIIGLIAIGIGYYIAITTHNPLKALSNFFVAVVLVIIGTYFLFVAGSIALLKCLKKNERYYYKNKHMIAVSGLLYRMKQNAVGLASISIMATAVMVMVSATLSLYAGINDTLKQDYPHHLICTASIKNGDIYEKIDSETLQSFINKAANDNSVEIKSIEEKRFLSATYLFKDNELSTDKSIMFDMFSENLNHLMVGFFITQDEYEELSGEELSLAENEVAICKMSGEDMHVGNEIKLASKQFKVKKNLKEFPIEASDMRLFNCYGIVLSDNTVFNDVYVNQKEAYGDMASEIDSEFQVDFKNEKVAKEKDTEMENEFINCVREYQNSMYPNGDNTLISDWSSVFEAEDNLYGLNGSLLFLGLLLTVIFLFATALIIYYKQISEGYEDRKRFQIMQKVGMSSNEVKSAIHSQILIVFFLPIIVAGIHLIAAYPLLSKLLKILFLSSDLLFIGCAGVAFLLFGIIYVIIYSMTAKVYYDIVH